MSPLISIFKIWLKSIGAEIDGHRFTYEGGNYKFTIWVESRPFLQSYNMILDIACDETWLGINSDANIDICDPSFDPDIFFKPFKDYLENSQ